jgi:hypothetical protein
MIKVECLKSMCVTFSHTYCVSSKVTGRSKCFRTEMAQEVRKRKMATNVYRSLTKHQA